jgi:hypothetical protein
MQSKIIDYEEQKYMDPWKGKKGITMEQMKI